MAGDFSRSTVNPVKHYAGVLMQQGRVQVDADWNEQLALQLYRTWTETRDLIGLCGTPKAGTGFAISSFAGGADLRIGNGRYYVNGLLCEISPQRIPAWLPPVSSPPSPPNNVMYQMSSGESFSGAMRKIELLPKRGGHGPVVTPGRQIYIPSLTIDDSILAAGDWVEISAEGGAAVTAMVTEVGTSAAPNDASVIVPSYYPITVNTSLSKLANAGRVTLRRVVTFTTQPFFTNQWDASVETSPPSGPATAALSLPNGDYLVALEAWQREIDALQDSHIREVALGGPDTCERLQTVWQLHILPWSGESSPPGSPLPSPLPSPPSPPNCCSDFPSWDAYTATTRTTGLMNAQAPPPGNNLPPCQLPPSAGYLGLANQLYRVEIFQSGDFNESATFVWSRDNAMVETPIVCIDSLGNVYVNSLGTDDLHSLELNDWVEIVDDDADLAGQPRFLAQISQPPGAAEQPPCASTGVQAYCLNVQPSAPARFQNQTNLRLRRWDMPNTGMALDGSGNPIGILITPGWIQLENNIQVNFSHGFYAARSYWQIPARTATADIEWPPFQVPNTNPIPQPPLGPDHFFCRLALLSVNDGKIKVTDCRCTFPSLTSICADDVCYRGSGCELSPVGTVAEALDELEAKHRMHNRTLHGSGVVCGLAVSCAGENQTSVRVAEGYAIDCEGYDLILDAPDTVNLSSLITLSPDQSVIPDGEFELILERNTLVPVDESSGISDSCCSKTVPATNPSNACVQFRAIQCAAETLADEVLTGTLAMEFYTGCLKPWIIAFKEEYQQRYISSDKQVTDAQALLSALTDLMIQYVQPVLTRDVYISRREAELLEEFYLFILDRLRDSTYCSLRAGMRKFPEYALDAPIETIFGKGLMTRLRVLPTGHWAFACGNGPGLDIYDLSTGQLAASVTPPIPGDAADWTLQDVAFSPDGKAIYVIATGVNTQTNASDSFFAVGQLNGASVAWGIQGSAGAHPYITLATANDQTEAVFATVQGSGIWAIAFADSVTVTQLAEFNAIGHLVSLQRTLYVTVNSEAASGGSFNEVQSYLAEITPAGGFAKPLATWPLVGVTGDLTDDLLVGNYAGEAGAQIPLIFVTGLSPTTSTKQVTLFEAEQSSKQIQQLNLDVNTTVRMALNPSGASVLVSCESTSVLISISGLTNALALSTYAPVELHPTSLAFAESSPSANALYVLNSTANTISEMPATMAAFSEFPALEEYRINALNAFIDLGAVLLENLKDCFCSLLLPTCASCDRSAPEGNGVGLACITVQNGVVTQICNLEKRKIVKSFSTVGYWLSLIPVIPLVKVMFEKFCCAALPAIFSKWAVYQPTPTHEQAPGYVAKFNALSGEDLRYSMTQASKFNVAAAYSGLAQKSAPVGKLTLDSFVSQFSRPAAPATSVSVSRINGMSLDQAKTALQNANVQVVATETYNPATFAQNVGDYVTAPSAVPPGSSVTLVVDSTNTVRYYIPTPAAVDQLSATVQTNQASVETQLTAANQATEQLQTRVTTIETAEQPALQNIQSLQTLVGTLQNQLNTLQTSQASELALRDQQIAQLTTTTQQLQSQLSTVTDLANQVKSIETRLSPPSAG